MKLSTKITLVGLAVILTGLMIIQAVPIAVYMAFSILGGGFLGLALGYKLTDE